MVKGAGSGVVGTLLDDAVLAGTELVLASTVELGAELLVLSSSPSIVLPGTDLLVLSSTVVFATVEATVESGLELLVETPVVSGVVGTLLDDAVLAGTELVLAAIVETTVETIELTA